MRKFTKADPDLLAKATRESIKIEPFDGDGCQAPGAVTLRKVRDGDRPEYAVHFANTQCGGYHSGFYTRDYAEALVEFGDRLTRYDPDGSRRASFAGFAPVAEPA